MTPRLLSLHRPVDSSSNPARSHTALLTATQPVHEPVTLTLQGFADGPRVDATGQPFGPSKALYAYPSEHYAFWQTVRAQAAVAHWDLVVPPGSMGEDLSLAGLLETQVWIGDVLRFPDCELAVSEPRSADAQIGTAMGFAQAESLMASSGWSGFYLAVRTPGSLQAGQPFELVPGPREVNIRELLHARRPRKTR